MIISTPTPTIDQVLEPSAGHPEQQPDQAAGADHLGQQVEDRDHDGRGGRGTADGHLAHPVRQLVGHRVAAGVAQQLGDQQQGHQPGHQEADGVEEPVVAVEGDRPGDAEEGRGRHVVAADGQAVLEAAEGPAAGVVVGGGVALPRRPEGDAQGEGDHGQEQGDGQDSVPGDHGPRSKSSLGSISVSNSSRSLLASGSRFLVE